MFHKAKQSRIFQDVVDQIQEAIVLGKIQVGEQLPAERELKERFNVSRGTLREALRVLEQKGLIVIKTGVAGGSVVKGVTTEQISESLGLLIRYQKVSLQDLAEFREGIEGIVAGLATERATTQNIDELQHLLAEAHDHIEKGTAHWDDFIRIDEKIHLMLAQITGNPLFISLLQTVYFNIHTYYESYLAKEEPLLQENYRDLLAIVDAVVSREADQARLLAQDHVRRFNSYMEDREPRE